MYDVVSPDVCVGCGVCAAACPKDAISLEYDDEGFLAPSINLEKCIHCQLCQRVCPSNSTPHFLKEDQEAFCAYNKEAETHQASTSGGIFTAVANYVLERKGVVFGAVMEGSYAIHRAAENSRELAPMRGSKYIQSQCSVYKHVKQELSTGRLVLFSGTPCQVDALKRYLKKDDENLITCEVACYGVGSQKVFNDFLNHITPQGTKVENIYFRKKGIKYKPSSFCVEFVNGEIYQKPSYQNYFGYTFSRHLITRKSCSTCRYSSKKRCADFSMGDYSEPDVSVCENKARIAGLSLLFVNSDKARNIMNNLTSLGLEEKNIESIRSIAFHERKDNNEKRTLFFAEYDSVGFAASYKKYSSEIKKVLRNNTKIKIKTLLKSFLNKLIYK